jgi:hypothetical protein
MKALSVRAPWWWFILHAGKDIENRDWPTGVRGTVYLHASKWWGMHEVRADFEYADDILCHDRPSVLLNDMRSAGGCIVGTVDIVDCVRQSKSPWFNGDYGFVLRNPVAFEKPIPFKGALGFFDVPATVMEAL